MSGISAFSLIARPFLPPNGRIFVLKAQGRLRAEHVCCSALAQSVSWEIHGRHLTCHL